MVANSDYYWKQVNVFRIRIIALEVHVWKSGRAPARVEGPQSGYIVHFAFPYEQQ